MPPSAEKNQQNHCPAGFGALRRQTQDWRLKGVGELRATPWWRYLATYGSLWPAANKRKNGINRQKESHHPRRRFPTQKSTSFSTPLHTVDPWRCHHTHSVLTTSSISCHCSYSQIIWNYNGGDTFEKLRKSSATNCSPTQKSNWYWLMKQIMRERRHLAKHDDENLWLLWERFLFLIPSMGLVCLPTWMVDFYGKWVDKYTNPMDRMGFAIRKEKNTVIILPTQTMHCSKGNPSKLPLSFALIDSPQTRRAAGFNPSGKYSSNWNISPGSGEN